MDPLSDVLSLLKPRSSVSAGLDAGGNWALAFPAHEGIKFNAVMRGTCWIRVEGETATWRLAPGDGFLLTQGRPFTLATDLSLPPAPSAAIYDAARDGVATCNGGGDFFLVGGRFVFAGEHARLLFGALPPLVHVREASGPASVLRWSLERLAAELREQRPGGGLMARHLAHIMLVQVLRLYLDAPGSIAAGWLSALADRRLAAAVGAMHADPARRWRLHELARLSGMSRSTFAHAFKAAAGIPPLGYLTRWRMLVAADRLRHSQESVAAVAAAAGYASESAFSTAFKKAMARPPRRYRDGPQARHEDEPS